MQKKKSLNKMTRKEVLKNKGRFFSLFSIILLGVAFFVGITQAGPDMLYSANDYFKKHALSDGTLLSSIGFTKEEVAKISQLGGIKNVTPTKSLTLELTDKNQVVTLFSLNEQMNKPRVVQGRLPQKENEIALDSRVLKLEEIKIGDTLTLHLPKKETEQLKQKSFQVVGFANLPNYIENIGRGNTNVGKGSVDFFGIVEEAVFDFKEYTQVNYQLKESFASGYSASYKKAAQNRSKSLKKEVQTILTNRLNENIQKQKEKLSSQKKKLENGEATVAREKKRIELAQKELVQAKEQWQFLPEEKQQALKAQEKTLANAKKEITKQEKTLQESKVKLEKAQKELAKGGKLTTFATTRFDNAGYEEYKENAKRLSEIATVFPVFFFLIASLICFTTMTRMVDENRVELGTLKSLGYTTFDISKKYMVYCLIISLFGTIFGTLVGSFLFPSVIFQAYQSLYNLLDFKIQFYPVYLVISLFVALFCTLGAAFIALRVDLKSMPSTLLQPKVPKSGKKIFLEKWGFFWKRLSFLEKVALRNLFRYKGRMVMVILGIAGCMALIVTGFGLKDSLSAIPELQLSQINHYQVILSVKKDLPKVKKELADEKVIKKMGVFSFESMKVTGKQNPAQSVSVYVPSDQADFPSFITLRDRKSQKTEQLTDEGAVISEKLAKLFHKKVGDELTVTTGGNKVVKVKVAGIFENYVWHTLYFTKKGYEKAFGKSPKENVIFLKTENLSSAQEDDLATKWMANDSVAGVRYTSETSAVLSDSLESLNVVIWILILSAGLLAFVVLYNLTNINIAERVRELSTIKVLGFYDAEVTLYIYRENILLSIGGILAGCVLGRILHSFVLKTAELDHTMFSPTIQLTSYIVSGCITFLFSVIVLFIMHRKLKKIDMIEALKAME